MSADFPQKPLETTKAKAKETLQRGKRNIFITLAKLIFHRGFTVSLFILLQLAVLAVPAIWLSNYFSLFYLAYAIISLVAVLQIVSSRFNPAYKIAWVIPVLAVPVFGGLMYLLYGGNRMSKRLHTLLLEVTVVAA